jgi:class 3 adenylate cyclase/tetratricopeptide (TPR) repeat protein
LVGTYKNKSIAQLFELIDAKDRLRSEIADGPDICLNYARAAMDQGHFALAYDLLNAGLDQFPEDPKLCHLAGLALAQSGSLEQASAVLAPALESIATDHPMAVEILSLAGRIAKDRWRFATGRQAIMEAGKLSVHYYMAAFERTKEFFPGINAATMMRLTGNIAQAKMIASEVKGICARQAEADHWCLATLAEANLLLGEVAEAEKNYRQAASMAAGRYSDLASMKRQLRLICASLDLPEEILHCIPIPKVAALADIFADADLFVSTTGPSMEINAVATAALKDRDIGFGYSSAACGLDLAFIIALQQAGMETNIVLPFDRTDFRNIRVGPAGEIWIKEFDNATDKATRTIIATREGYRGDDSLFSYATDLIIGLAVLRAKQLETNVVTYVVTDSHRDADGDRKKTFLDHYNLKEGDVIFLDRADLTPTKNVVTARGDVTRQRDTADAAHRRVMTMVFADVVGFSGFGEESTPAFVGFLDEIANIIDDIEHQPVFKNTWGDGLFLVFDDAAIAAQFALTLHETIMEIDWAARGLPASTNIRIGIHTGPVFPADDKVIGRRNYFGTHVNRAARVEPVATPGTSFATEETAAVLAAQKTPSISLDYLGERPLAKGFGSHRLYRLRRESEVDHLI